VLHERLRQKRRDFHRETRVRLQLHALAYNLGNVLRTLTMPEPIRLPNRRPGASNDGSVGTTR
jgi:hypothetical protein